MTATNAHKAEGAGESIWISDRGRNSRLEKNLIRVSFIA
jgi:hypothetical protein